jgi:hypothetical protein
VKLPEKPQEFWCAPKFGINETFRKQQTLWQATVLYIIKELI